MSVRLPLESSTIASSSIDNKFARMRRNGSVIKRELDFKHLGQLQLR